MTARVILIAAILAIAAYSVYEIRIWARDKEGAYISHRQRRIRSTGLVLLFSALILWVYGTYLPTPNTHIRPLPPEVRKQATLYVGYWMFTILLTVPLIPLALLDTRENLRRAAEERKKIFRETILAAGMEDENTDE